MLLLWSSFIANSNKHKCNANFRCCSCCRCCRCCRHKFFTSCFIIHVLIRFLLFFEKKASKAAKCCWLLYLFIALLFCYSSFTCSSWNGNYSSCCFCFCCLLLLYKVVLFSWLFFLFLVAFRPFYLSSCLYHCR